MLPRRVTDVNSQLYIEHGLIKHLAIFANLNFKVVRTSSQSYETDDFSFTLPNGGLAGLGNSTIGLKYNLLNKSLLVSLSHAVEFQSLGDNIDRGLRTGYNTYAFVSGVHLGQSFAKNFYYALEAFYAPRNRLSDEWRLNAELGYSFKKPLILAFKVNVRESFRNKIVEESTNYLSTGLYLNNQEYVAWNVSIIQDKHPKVTLIYALSGGFTTSLIARTPVFTFGLLWNIERS
jgi:hypothetical protein